MAFTVSFEENGNGWNKFHSWMPEQMAGLNNKLFSFKNGQLYIHHDDSVPRCNYYGIQYTAKIKTVFNQAMEDDKIFKTLVLESTVPLDVVVRTNYANGTLSKEEFKNIESRYFAYLRKNESVSNLFARATQGVGQISGSSGTTITFPSVPNNINVGDTLFQVNGATHEQIGTISNITSTTIVVDSIVTAPVNARFCYVKKPARIEGGEIRGFYMEVELEYDGTQAIELFAISTNAVKSYI